MSPKRLKAIEQRLRTMAGFFELQSRAQALDDITALLDELRRLQAELRQYHPEPYDMRSLVEANAKKVDETAKRILASLVR